jgi:hypothetical protein
VSRSAGPAQPSPISEQPPDGRGGWGIGNHAADATISRGATWVTGLILIPCAILFLILLFHLWPPPKPREGFTLAFEQKTLAVKAGDPATYTILIRAHSGFAGSVTLRAGVLPDNLTPAFTPPGETPTPGFLGSWRRGDVRHHRDGDGGFFPVGRAHCRRRAGAPQGGRC